MSQHDDSSSQFHEDLLDELELATNQLEVEVNKNTKLREQNASEAKRCKECIIAKQQVYEEIRKCQKEKTDQLQNKNKLEHKIQQLQSNQRLLEATNDSLAEEVEALTESQQMSSDDLKDLNQEIKDLTTKIVRLETEKSKGMHQKPAFVQGQNNSIRTENSIIKSLTNDRKLRQAKIKQLRLNPN